MRLRFGYPRYSYKAIGKLTGLPETTVAHKVHRFLARGNMTDYRKFNKHQNCPEMPETVKTFLMKRETLAMFAMLGLDRRCDYVRQKFGFSMSRMRLKTLYKKAGIKFGRPEWTFDRALARKTLQSERFEFAQALQAQDVLNTIYLDETSFNPEQKPGKTWQHTAEKLVFVHPSYRPKSLTVYGACGMTIDPVFHVAHSTNKEDFLEFLKKVKTAVGDRNISVVLDNHKAHKAEVVNEYCRINNIQMMFMPPYSCRFNS